MNNGMKTRAIDDLHHYCPRLKARVILIELSNVTRSVALIALAFIQLLIHNLQRAPEFECKTSPVIENCSILFYPIFCELLTIFTVFGIPFYILVPVEFFFFFTTLSYH